MKLQAIGKLILAGLVCYSAMSRAGIVETNTSYGADSGFTLDQEGYDLEWLDFDHTLIDKLYNNQAYQDDLAVRGYRVATQSEFMTLFLGYPATHSSRVGQPGYEACNDSPSFNNQNQDQIWCTYNELAPMYSAGFSAMNPYYDKFNVFTEQDLNQDDTNTINGIIDYDHWGYMSVAFNSNNIGSISYRDSVIPAQFWPGKGWEDFSSDEFIDNFGWAYNTHYQHWKPGGYNNLSVAYVRSIPVPEPSTPLLLVALAGLLTIRSRLFDK